MFRSSSKTGAANMQITRFTDYSLRVLMLLGLYPNRLVTIEEIAQRHGISHEHLRKIVHRLAILGYIESVRGRHGGLRLALEPEDIRVGEVVRDFEKDMNIAECFASDPAECPIDSCCRIQAIFHEALGAFLDVLDGYTLRDLLSPRRRLLRLLDNG